MKRNRRFGIKPSTKGKTCQKFRSDLSTWAWFDLKCISHWRMAVLKAFLATSNRKSCKKSEISALKACEVKHHTRQVRTNSETALIRTQTHATVLAFGLLEIKHTVEVNECSVMWVTDCRHGFTEAGRRTCTTGKSFRTPQFPIFLLESMQLNVLLFLKWRIEKKKNQFITQTVF